MATLDPTKNLIKVQVSTTYNNSATSIVLTGGEGAKLPAPSTDGAFNLIWYNDTDYKDPSDDPNVEIIRVTARATDTLTVTRGQESITATNKNTAGKTYKMLLGVTAKMITDIQTKLDSNSVTAIGGTWDGNGGVVQTTKTFSITVPYACTINNWYITTEGVSGSCIVDIKRSGTSIIGGGGNKPTLSSATSANAAVSGWTSVAVSAGDKLTFSVGSLTSLTDIAVTLKVTKS